MKRPAVFITYFQSTIQIVHVYQILRSEYFFQKFVGWFNLMSTFLAFHHFCEKTYKETYQFHDLFSNFLSLCGRWQNFVVQKLFSRKWRPFLNVNNFLFISATLSNICEKTYEKTYRFFLIFRNFNFILTYLQNLLVRKLKKRKCPLFQYNNKTLFILTTLNSIFHKSYEKPYVFYNAFLKFDSICTLSRSFIMTVCLQQKWWSFQYC